MTFGQIKKQNLPPSCTEDLYWSSQSLAMPQRGPTYPCKNKVKAKEKTERENLKQVLKTMFHFNRFTFHRATKSGSPQNHTFSYTTIAGQNPAGDFFKLSRRLTTTLGEWHYGSKAI